MQSITKKEGTITVLGIIIGAIAGYAYYHFIGCSSGSCAITSRPVNATLYGSVLGGLFFNIFVTHKKKE